MQAHPQAGLGDAGLAHGQVPRSPQLGSVLPQSSSPNPAPSLLKGGVAGAMGRAEALSGGRRQVWEGGSGELGKSEWKLQADMLGTFLPGTLLSLYILAFSLCA